MMVTPAINEKRLTDDVIAHLEPELPANRQQEQQAAAQRTCNTHTHTHNAK